MREVPIIKVGETLIATVHDDLTDHDALAFQETLNAKLEQGHVSSVLIDMSLVKTMDSFLGRVLRETALGARLLGAETVIAGIQPFVAMTLVELGLSMEGIRTTLTVDRGLAVLDDKNAGAGA